MMKHLSVKTSTLITVNMQLRKMYYRVIITESLQTTLCTGIVGTRYLCVDRARWWGGEWKWVVSGEDERKEEEGVKEEERERDEI